MYVMNKVNADIQNSATNKQLRILSYVCDRFALRVIKNFLNLAKNVLMDLFFGNTNISEKRWYLIWTSAPKSLKIPAIFIILSNFSLDYMILLTSL